MNDEGLRINVNDLPKDDFEALVTKILEHVLRSDMQRKIAKMVSDEWERISVEDVTQTALDVLGGDYDDVLKICRALRHRQIDSKFTCDQMLMALGGYLTPVSISSGILWSQLSEKQSQVITERKRVNDTDAAARARAEVQCADINRNAHIMQELKESIIENINILKRIRDDISTEWAKDKVAPESSAGVAVMSMNKPW